MKQTLKSILGIGAITIFFYILFSILNFAQATAPEKPNSGSQGPTYDLKQFQQRAVPLYCGETGWVFQTAFEIFGEEPIAVAEVKSGGDLNSPTLGLLTFTYNESWNKGTIMMTLPSTGETCILAYGVNWEFWGQLKSKKILDEGNESK